MEQLHDNSERIQQLNFHTYHILAKPCSLETVQQLDTLFKM